MVSAATALALGAPPTQAGNRQPEWRQFLFTRTINGASNLDIYVGTASSRNGKELTAVIPVYANRKGKVTGTDPGLLFASEGGVFPEAYAFGERVTCSDTGNPQNVCESADAGAGRASGIFFEFPDGNAPTHVVAVAYGVKPSIELGKTSAGWRVEEVLQPMISMRSARESEAVGVYHRSTAGAELFLSATVDGGKGGSLVLAQPPCGYPPSVGFVNAEWGIPD